MAVKEWGNVQGRQRSRKNSWPMSVPDQSKCMSVDHRNDTLHFFTHNLRNAKKQHHSPPLVFFYAFFWRKQGGRLLEKLGGGVKIFDWAGVAKMGVALNSWPWPDESM